MFRSVRIFRLALVCLIMTFVSCKKGHRIDCFRSNGTETTEVRYPGQFHQIKVYDKIELHVMQGADYKVEVTAGEHIIANVKTDLQDTVLVIENENKCNFARGYKRKMKVTVTVPYVKWIGNFGVGAVHIDSGFKQDSTLFVRNENSGDSYINGKFNVVKTSSHGNGDFYLSGETNILEVYMFGTNYTHAENFRVRSSLDITTLSVGDAFFNLDQTPQFKYSIWKAGNIFYTGDPLSIVDAGHGQAYGKGKLEKR